MSEQPDKVVTITLNSSGLPVPNIDPVPVKKNKQKIRWCADFPFTITIDNYGDVTYSTGGECTYSAKTGNFNNEQRYKYAITANGKTNDPDIDVQP